VLQTDLDLLILGGGCAGLSLALRLAEAPGRCRRVAVIEARPDYANDRSWCFWRLGPHRFEALVTQSWSRIAVRSASRTVVADCPQTPYQLLEAGTFYTHARHVLANSDMVRLSLGVSVIGSPVAVAHGWRVETSAGALTAAQVIDTRPPSVPRHGDSTLWQSFFGQELVCERPVFDAACVELMDFTDAVQGAVAFTYVLPLAPDRALVETTLFDPHPRSPSDLARHHRRAVRRLCGDAPIRVVRSEAGMLPMGMAHDPGALGRGHLRAGLMSGAARPATGYAFQRIQRWADACGESLRHGETPRGHQPDPLLTRIMDRLFLDVLRSQPERGPELFVRLFGGTDMRRIVRFLGDRGTLLDRAAVVASLPAGLFLRQLLRSARRDLAEA
jgi:lycopene beta-cyclase